MWERTLYSHHDQDWTDDEQTALCNPQPSLTLGRAGEFSWLTWFHKGCPPLKKNKFKRKCSLLRCCTISCSVSSIGKFQKEQPKRKCLRGASSSVDQWFSTSVAKDCSWKKKSHWAKERYDTVLSDKEQFAKLHSIVVSFTNWRHWHFVCFWK